jgi:hypothetical protein
VSSAGQTVARRPDSRAAWLLALLLASVTAACGPSVPLPSGERPLDALARPTLSGDRFDPQSLAGQVVLVNFWSPG